MTMLPLSPELLDTFRSLSVKKRQGVLEIISPKREYELTFFEGKIIHADRIDQSFIQFLAEKIESVSSLLSTEIENIGRGEQITRLLQLTDLDLSKLIELKKAYDRETLSFLALESSFSFDFRTKIVRCPEGLSLELSPGHYLLDLLESTEAAEEPSSAPPLAEAPAKITIKTQAADNTEKPVEAATAIADEKIEPKINKTVIRNARQKKSRKPPKAGRFKTVPKKKKNKLSDILKLNAEQSLMGIKLSLILLLCLYAPGFLSDWSHTLYSFLLL